MRLAQINTVCDGSTGRIMGAIQRRAMEEGYETISFYGRRKGFADMPCRRFGNGVSFWIHVAINTLFDRQGSGSYFDTKRLIRELRRFDPDIIHLHNLHGYYINLNVLFSYLNGEFKGKVVWTFHDCWPITGHCPYFSRAKCDKWQTECGNCPQKTEYPICYGMDNSKRNYKDKKRLFTGLNNLTVICPSEWMKEIVGRSFLESADIRVVNNGIDNSIFTNRPRLKEISGTDISDKKVILGVARIWEPRKGLGVFLNIAEYLPGQYVVVLVGLKPGQIRRLPANIIGITRTANMDELAQIYSSADVFVNPSSEETFSLVTAEALACGTPVIVRAGSAVAELVRDGCGMVLDDPTTKDYIESILSLSGGDISGDRISESVSGYTLTNMTDEILCIYRNTVNNSSER